MSDAPATTPPAAVTPPVTTVTTAPAATSPTPTTSTPVTRTAPSLDGGTSAPRGLSLTDHDVGPGTNAFAEGRWKIWLAIMAALGAVGGITYLVTRDDKPSPLPPLAPVTAANYTGDIPLHEVVNSGPKLQIVVNGTMDLPLSKFSPTTINGGRIQVDGTRNLYVAKVVNIENWVSFGGAGFEADLVIGVNTDSGVPIIYRSNRTQIRADGTFTFLGFLELNNVNP